MNLELDFATIVAAFFAATAAFLFIRSLWNISLAYRSESWPEATGVILSSEIEKSRGSKGGTLTKPVVTYRYHAGGQERIGRCACIGDSMSTNIHALARRVVDRYRVDQQVTVRYHPDKPDLCVLEPGLNAHLIFEFAFASFLVLFATLIWWL